VATKKKTTKKKSKRKKKRTQAKKTCFVIAPIGEDGSETRERANDLFKYLIEPVVTACGYDVPIRADHIAESGEITSQIVDHLRDDALVIADLFERNPNVFYELALRHVVNLPVIMIYQAGEDLPFDITTLRAIPLDHSKIGSVEKCKEELRKHIKSFDVNPDIGQTPVSRSLSINNMKSSPKPEAKALAELSERIERLQEHVGSERRMKRGYGTVPSPLLAHLAREYTEVIAHCSGHLSPRISARLADRFTAVISGRMDPEEFHYDLMKYTKGMGRRK